MAVRTFERSHGEHTMLPLNAILQSIGCKNNCQLLFVKDHYGHDLIESYGPRKRPGVDDPDAVYEVIWPDITGRR